MGAHPAFSAADMKPRFYERTRLVDEGKRPVKAASLAPGPMFSAARGFAHHLRLNCGHPPGPALLEAIARVGRMACAGAGA